MKKILLFCSIAGLVLMTSCFQNDISKVKKSLFPGNDSVRIGKILDTSLDDPEWIRFESDKGQNVVQCSGNISEALHDRAVFYLTEKTMVDVMESLSGDNPFAMIGFTMGIEKFMRSLGTDVDKKLGQKLEELEVPEDAVSLAALYLMLDQKVWLSGESVQIQWVQQLSDGSFTLSYLGGDGPGDSDGDDILAILCDQPVTYAHSGIQKNLGPKMESLRLHGEKIRMALQMVLTEFSFDLKGLEEVETLIATEAMGLS